MELDGLQGLQVHMVVVAVFEIKSISNHMEFSNYSFASSLLVYQDIPASYLNPKQAKAC